MSHFLVQPQTLGEVSTGAVYIPLFKSHLCEQAERIGDSPFAIRSPTQGYALIEQGMCLGILVLENEVMCHIEEGPGDISWITQCSEQDQTLCKKTGSSGIIPL